ncbi:MAG TPA: GNAT family N-acetyltransferase [Methylomirabilota bacterium]|nr:GNAT family N-acetyltransferase [Methylomirabilota bacterium]
MPILIRRYRPDDAERLLEAARESVEQIFPWMPWARSGYSLEDSRAWIAHCEATWAQGVEYNFAIVDQDDRYLGGCGLNQLNRGHRVANLGYWVRTSARARGIATAAVPALADFAFRETDLARLEIVVAVGNAASHRVAEKSGAIREGLAHDRLHLHGRQHDAVVYALLRPRPHPHSG